MARLRLLLLLAGLLVTATACGVAEPEADGPTAGARPWGRPDGWKYDRIRAPGALRVRQDREEPRLVVEMSGPGEVAFRGERWFGRRAWDRAAIRAALEVLLEQACRAADVRAADAACGLPLRLHVDGCVPWAEVEDVLQVGVEPPVRVERVQWTVHARAGFPVTHQEATRRLGAAEESPVEVVLRGVGGQASATTVEAAGWSETVEDDCWAWAASYASDEADREDVLDAWNPLVPLLRRQGAPARGAALHIEGDLQAVAWRHVVKVFDLLLEAGVRDLEAPAFGGGLRLSEPDDTSGPPFVYPDDPVATPVVVFLATFMVLGAFVLTFLPLWIERSARKRPGGPPRP